MITGFRPQVAVSRSTTVLIVGAGLAGLTAASRLRQRGIEVLVVDKARGVGGRMATRRIGEAVFDHGAQFMTVRNREFARAISDWSNSGVVKEWFRSAGTGGGHTRYCGNPAMTAVAKELARPLAVQLEARVSSLKSSSRPDSNPGDRPVWVAAMQSGQTIIADAVLLTAPVPQSLALLDDGKTGIPGEVRDELEYITYDPCIAVMARLEQKSSLPEEGWVMPQEGPIAWMADNQTKGVSPLPAVTIHASARFSAEHWDDNRQQVGELLVAAARKWLGSAVAEFQVHGWRYSKPVRTSTAKVGTVDRDATGLPPLVFAGDAFGGPRVEGAFLSGRAAADYLMRELDN